MQRALAVTTYSVDETRIVAAALGPVLLPGDVLSLSGDLGAGKTVFVQGLAGALGIEGRVTSPTFTIVHHYEARYPIVHLDVYRLNSFQEVLDLGFEELLDGSAIVVIEWGNAISPLLPRRHLDVEIATVNGHDDHRRLVFRPHGQEWIRKIQAMRATAETLLDAVSSEDAPRPRFEVTTDRRARDDRGDITTAGED